MNETIGQRILRLRKNKGFTQEQLAEKLNITAQAVSKWENDVSLPDIQTVPALARVLGVSTDELFGIEKTSEQKSEDDGDSKHEFSASRSAGWIVLAVVFIAVGLAYILSQTGNLPFTPPDSIWSVIWPVAVLGTGVLMMFHRFSVFSLGVCICGAYFLLYNFGIIWYTLSWSVVLAALLILLGLSILFDRVFRQPVRKKRAAFVSDKEKIDVNQSDGHSDMRCSFGSCTQQIEGDVFRSANINVSFGEGTLALTDCAAAGENAEINAKVSFGELKIRCPRHFKIITYADRSFGSVETQGEASPDAQFTITLNGSVAFGCINILYI